MLHVLQLACLYWKHTSLSYLIQKPGTHKYLYNNAKFLFFTKIFYCTLYPLLDNADGYLPCLL